MLSRDRVIDVIEHRKPDRIPIYGWVRANLEEQLTQAFGSVEAFEDRYEFDLAHLFGGPGPYPDELLEPLHETYGETLTPGQVLDIHPADPNDSAAYDGIRQALRHHQAERGRFCYIQTPGIFECLNKVFGIENHLMYLALYEKELHDVYRRQAEWNRAFAMNCLDLGVDMVHVSDDWGAQTGLMFSPRTWHTLIAPTHRITCDAVRKRNAYLSLHSDGNIMPVLDGIVDLGYQVVHPYQESAGMDYDVYRHDYANRFVIMGGLDVQTTIGFGDRPRLQTAIERLVGLFADGGLLLCTTHFVQDHCSIEELTFAYDLIYDLVRHPGKVNAS